MRREQSISMNYAMVNAILAGTKTQFRRVADVPPFELEISSTWWETPPERSKPHQTCGSTYPCEGMRPARWFTFEDARTNGEIENRRTIFSKIPTKSRALRDG